MGWSFFNEFDRKGMIAWLRQAYVGERYDLKKSTTIGNNFWALLQSKADGGFVIAMDRIEGGTKRDPGWGYKSMSHLDGVNCPMKYLDSLAPPADSTEFIWREQVRQFHEKSHAMKDTKAALAAGTIVCLGEKKFRLVRNLARKGWEVFCLDDDRTYRMKATQLNTALRKAAT